MFRKKSSGSIVNVFFGILGILAAVILMMAFLFIVQIADYKSEVKQIARCYALKMETEGYLTVPDKSLLIQDLTACGLENISLDGTSMTPAGYGRDIVLSISGDVKSKTLNTSSGIITGFLFEDMRWDISVRLQSTAKY